MQTQKEGCELSSHDLFSILSILTSNLLCRTSSKDCEATQWMDPDPASNPTARNSNAAPTEPIDTKLKVLNIPGERPNDHSMPFKVLPCMSKARKSKGERGAVVAPQNPYLGKPPLSLPAAPTLTFVTEVESNSPSLRRLRRQEKPRQCHDTFPGPSNSSSDESGQDPNLPVANRSNTTHAASAVIPAYEDASEVSPARDGSTTPQAGGSKDVREGQDHYLYDMLASFTWINEMYNEETVTEGISSPFSSNVSINSDVDFHSGWGSTTDSGIASTITTPSTDSSDLCEP